MKIPSTDISSLTNLAKNAPAQKAEQGASQSATATATQSTRSAGVAVTVSPMARSLEKTEATQPGDIDTGKVATVKAAIEDGSYVVNPEAIADKLLSNAQEMLNRTTR
jgi:negative regulator of flagellin synthesis FlgM